MNKTEKAKLKSMLDDKVKVYLEFSNRDDYPDKPCVRRAVYTLQNTVFNLAEVLWDFGVITWEVCCEYWSKVSITDDNENCPFLKCGANTNGVCEYVKKEGDSNGSTK